MKGFPVLEPMITLVPELNQCSRNQAPFLPDPPSVARRHPRARIHPGHTSRRSSTPGHPLTLVATVLETLYSIPCCSCVSVRSFSRAATLEETLSFGSVYTRLLKDWRKLEVRESKVRHTYDSSTPASGLGNVEVATVATSSRRSCIDSHIVPTRLLSVITTLQQLDFQQEEQAWIG